MLPGRSGVEGSGCCHVMGHRCVLWGIAQGRPWVSAASRSTLGPQAAPAHAGLDASPAKMGSARVFPTWLQVLRFLPPLCNP